MATTPERISAVVSPSLQREALGAQGTGTAIFPACAVLLLLLLLLSLAVSADPSQNSQGVINGFVR